MRILCFAIFGGLFGQPVSFKETMDWLVTNVNAHAKTEYQNPPSVKAQTTWEITERRGCELDVKQVFHREAIQNITAFDGALSTYEDEAKTYTFDLTDLHAKNIRAVTAEKTPYVILTSVTDVFGVKTEHKSKTVRTDGSERDKAEWSMEQRARTLWIYFGAGGTDNTKLAREMETNLRTGVDFCRSGKTTK